MTQLSHPVSTPAPRPTRALPKPIWTALVLRRFLRGCAEARRAGAAPSEATAIELRRLFRLTNGRFNRIAGWSARLRRPARPFASNAGLLGTLDRDESARIRHEFTTEGLCRFDVRIPPERCARLRMLARRWPCQVLPKPPGDARLRFDPDQPSGTRFTIDPPARVYTAPDVQQIIADESILTAAQTMLGCRPVFCGAAMWWSAPFAEGASSAAAQLYHFDMAQIRFVKFFAYLTDVGPEQGPHSFIRGSHTERPSEFLEDRRYTDAEMIGHYGRDRVVEITGRAGTVFAEDTSGFHKGTHPTTGNRLLLQLIFSTHGFSAGVAGLPLPSVQTPEFRRALDRYPSVFRHFRRFGP